MHWTLCVFLDQGKAHVTSAFFLRARCLPGLWSVCPCTEKPEPRPNLCNYLKTFFFLERDKKKYLLQFPSKLGDFLACNLLKQQRFSLPQWALLPWSHLWFLNSRCLLSCCSLLCEGNRRSSNNVQFHFSFFPPLLLSADRLLLTYASPSYLASFFIPEMSEREEMNNALCS